MPRPGPRIPEKAKDFKGSIKRLIKNLSKWKFIMIMSLMLALISAILALVAPNKLSKFADTISEGLKPNTEKISEVISKTQANLYSEETLGKLQKLTIELTPEETILVYNALESKEAMPLLPTKVLEVILDDIDLSYEAWDFGTEELVYYTPSTPVITETQYNFNAVDMIRNNYFAIKALKDAAFSGDYNDLENKPESIKNPNALTIIGKDVTTVYDGSEAKTISIPKEVNDLIKDISGVTGGIVDTWRPLIIQNSSGNNILTLGSGNTSGALTLKAGNNITFADNDGIIVINNNYSLPAATTTLGGIKTGGDLILANGIATVKDLSTISDNASRGLEAYNWGNHDGKYLPLRGGTLNGDLIVSGDMSKIIRNIKLNTNRGWAISMYSLQVDGVTKFTIAGYGHYIPGDTNNNIHYAFLGCNPYDGTNLRISPTELKWGDATILHAYNYTSYINETNFPGINKTGTYNKPTAGIPKSDLDLSVQTSLGKADTALQSYTEQYKGTVTTVKVGPTSYTPYSGIVTLPAYPTTLPASDVYSWAKASSKPAYSWNEITNKPTIPTVGNATITIKQNNTTIGSFTTNQTNNATITLPNTATYGLGYPGTPGLAQPAGFTTDTGFSISNHKNCYYAVQINGEDKLVVNIPKVYTVVDKIPEITIGEKSKIVYTPTTTPFTVKLNSSSKNSYTHLYVINNLNKSITITFNAENVIGPTSITSSNSSSGISVDLYVTEDGTIVIEPIK
jgi:hypothetical protein